MTTDTPAGPERGHASESVCPLCRAPLDPDEMDDGSDIPPDGAGVCSQCYARWHDAPVYEKRADAARAMALEEAARVCDGLANQLASLKSTRRLRLDDGSPAAARELAASIRALAAASPASACPACGRLSSTPCWYDDDGGHYCGNPCHQPRAAASPPARERDNPRGGDDDCPATTRPSTPTVSVSSSGKNPPAPIGSSSEGESSAVGGSPRASAARTREREVSIRECVADWERNGWEQDCLSASSARSLLDTIDTLRTLLDLAAPAPASPSRCPTASPARLHGQPAYEWLFVAAAHYLTVRTEKALDVLAEAVEDVRKGIDVYEATSAPASPDARASDGDLADSIAAYVGKVLSDGPPVMPRLDLETMVAEAVRFCLRARAPVAWAILNDKSSGPVLDRDEATIRRMATMDGDRVVPLYAGAAPEARARGERDLIHLLYDLAVEGLARERGESAQHDYAQRVKTATERAQRLLARDRDAEDRTKEVK